MNRNGVFAFGDQFAEYIKMMIPGTKEASGGKELVCRCKYCSDSEDLSHGHMYIKIPQSRDDVPLFHCFKCQTSGILDSRSLIDWGIYDPIIGQELDNINKQAVKKNGSQEFSKTWYNFYNYIEDYNLAQIKLDYINNRIGTNLTFSECKRQKIILNLRDALNHNNVEKYTRHPNIINQLNDNFVGFLSLDNNFVNLRRICNEGIVYESIDKRYINYNIHDKKDNTEKMYIMPDVINLYTPDKINIHIAEGPFDILSIRYNLRKNETGIYAAVTGSGYKGLIMHIISQFRIFNFNIHLYPDNDKFGNQNIINEIVDRIRPYNAVLYEHRNLYGNEKDFGVIPERINEKIYVHY